MSNPNLDPFRPSEELLEQELGSIVADFTVFTIPQGSAPDEVKQAWMGTVLPVREHLLAQHSGRQVYREVLSGELKENPDTIPVYGFDATAALRAVGKNRAADYWTDNGFEFATLNFRGNEGVLRRRPTTDA